MTCIDDDLEWERMPTALESARYDEARRCAESLAARRKAEEAEAAKVVFGDCLMRLIALGMAEAKARPMLGKWRSQAKDDALLVRIVQQAERIGTPDPISYVTKAIASSKERVDATEKRMTGGWSLLGWEAPLRRKPTVKWRQGERGQVWLDPYGKKVVMQPKAGTVAPSLEDEPGIEVE
jgi:hypothetical protein